MTDQESTGQLSVQTRPAELTRQWDSRELPVADDDQPPTAEIRPVHEPPQGSSGPALRRGAHLRGLLGASTGVWVGLGLVTAGFVAIFYSWTTVAGVIHVALQMPYVVSGGITGLALVIVGVTVVDVAVRRQGSHERTQQLTQINRIVAELHDFLESDEVRVDDRYREEER